MIRKVGLECFTVCVLLLFAMSPCFRVHAAEPIRFVFNCEDKEVFPYWIGEGTDIVKPDGGVSYELLKLIDERIDEIEIVFERYPWRRCQQNLKRGKADGIIGSVNSERLEIGAFPINNGVLDSSMYLNTQDYCLYTGMHTALAWDGHGFNMTKDILIAVPRGYSIIPFLKEQHLEIYEVETAEATLRMLGNGRVDGAVAPCLAMEAALVDMPDVSRNVFLNPIPLEKRKYYIIMSRQFARRHPELSRKIWRTAREVAAEYFDVLVERYLQGRLKSRELTHVR